MRDWLHAIASTFSVIVELWELRPLAMMAVHSAGCVLLGALLHAALTE